jgi:hypothetical protein
MVSILEPEPESKKQTSQSAAAPASTSPARQGVPIWTIVVMVLLAAGLGWLIYAQVKTQKALADQAEPLAKAKHTIERLQAQLDSVQKTQAKVQAQADVWAEKLGLTQQEVDKTEALAAKYRKDQLAQLAALDALTGEVGAVKDQVATTAKTLDETRAQLQRAMGDLGEQSGLIARNSSDLAELKRRGERDYFDFDLSKAKSFDRVGPIAIRLRKTDPKRSKFTLTLLADDKEIEKKDKTLLEPVQFYMKGKKTVNEIVVYEIIKDRVIGYLSVAKDASS